MSEQEIEFLVEWLLTDDEVRHRFLRDRLETVTAWLNAGIQLTGSEIDALVRLDATVWSRVAERVGCAS